MQQSCILKPFVKEKKWKLKNIYIYILDLRTKLWILVLENLSNSWGLILACISPPKWINNEYQCFMWKNSKNIPPLEWINGDFSTTVLWRKTFFKQHFARFSSFVISETVELLFFHYYNDHCIYYILVWSPLNILFWEKRKINVWMFYVSFYPFQMRSWGVILNSTHENYWTELDSFVYQPRFSVLNCKCCIFIDD